MKKNILLTLKNIRNKWLVVPVVTDIVFIICFGFVFEFVRMNVSMQLENIVNIIRESAVQILPGAFDYSSLMANLKGLPGFTASYNSIILNLLLMVVLVFVLWISLQSASWWFAYRLDGRAMRFSRFLKRFTLKSIPYFIFVGIAMFITIRLALGYTLAGEEYKAGMAYTYFTVFTVVVALFMFLSYADIEDNLIQMLRKWRTILVMYGLAIGKLLIAHILLILIGEINYIVMIVAGIFLLMPLLTYTRMFMINVLKK